ncbi:TonB-dependent receptor [Lentisalinibacter sediminis]|uniref:TonB-dependent receptor n=1 Tax=Lentisalinibacter sediminis TaxID=2992237 RepID=UPI00386DD334
MADNQHFGAAAYSGSAIAAAVSAALAGPSAYAQTQGDAIEEIVVTATKREESLADIPMSIRAFTTDDIVRQGLQSLDDYVGKIPSLALARREPAGNNVVFRGVAASGIDFGTGPSSSVYLDEQPITASGLNPDPRLVDIARLEALSGPQGTLFGDASQSGTLRIITNKPDPTAFDAWVELEANQVADGDTGYDVSGMLNIPLADNKLALRLVGFTAEEAGFIDNVLGTSPGGTYTNEEFVEDDINTTTISGGRAALRWFPNDRWTVDTTAIFQSTEADGFGDKDFDQSDLEQVRFFDERFEEDWYQLALTLEGSTGIGDFMFSVSYFDREVDYEADGTEYMFAFQELSDADEAYFNDVYGTDYDFYFYDFGGEVVRGYNLDNLQSERFSIEARWSTPEVDDSRWRGIVGLFYQSFEDTDIYKAGAENFAGSPAFYYLAYNAYNPSLNGLPPGSWDFSDPSVRPGDWFFGIYDSEIDQFALFGEATFYLTDSLTVTAGGRWYQVDRKERQVLGALQQGPVPNPETDFVFTDGSGDESDDGFVPKVNVTYNFSDRSLAYLTYSEGFRSGGANALRPNSVLPRKYDSDMVQNYEVGYKTTTAGGRLFLSVVGYHMIWDDIQLQVNDPQQGVFQLGVVNFPEATIDGVEVQTSFVPAPGWSLDATLAWNEAEISESATLFPGTGAAVEAVDGTRLPITPDWKGSLSIERTFQDTTLFGGTPFLRADYTYTGESINALAGLEATVVSPPPTIQDSYSVLDLRAGIDADKWSVGAYIANVFDEQGDQFINNRYAKRRVTVNQPLTFGVTYRRNFR